MPSKPDQSSMGISEQSKPTDQTAWRFTSLGFLLLNLAGLVLLWPFVYFVNRYLQEFFQEHLDGALPAFVQTMLWIPGWLLAAGVVIASLVLIVVQLTGEHKRSTWLNVVVGILVLIFLVVWMIAIGIGMVEVFNEAQGIHAPHLPVPREPPITPPVPDPVQPSTAPEVLSDG